jgi:hypothetical protein
MTDQMQSPKQTICFVLGVICLIAAGAAKLSALGRWVDLTYASEYVDAEFEIKRYRTETRQSEEDSCQVEGIIHPQNVKVSVSDNDVDLTRIGDQKGIIRIRPDRKEVEGRRIAVRYYTGKIDPHAMFIPAVATNAPVPTWRSFWLRAGICGVLLLLAGYCMWVAKIWRIVFCLD